MNGILPNPGSRLPPADPRPVPPAAYVPAAVAGAVAAACLVLAVVRPAGARWADDAILWALAAVASGVIFYPRGRDGRGHLV